MFSTSVLLLLSNGSLAKVWAMINEVQLLAYIFYMDLYMPGNAQAFFDFLIEISEFTWFDTGDYQDQVFDKIFTAFDGPPEKKPPSEARAMRMRRIRRKRKE